MSTSTGVRGANGFAVPGLWADASPEEHVSWYEQLGANVIQSFAVSCNGYAWYRGGVVPPQPGLKHDFLPALVKLGHERGMRVMGYFCVAANTRRGREHPDLSYGSPGACHIPLTDDYLDYLSRAIEEALRVSKIDLPARFTSVPLRSALDRGAHVNGDSSSRPESCCRRAQLQVRDPK